MTHRELLTEAFRLHGLSDSEIKRRFTSSAIKYPFDLDGKVVWQPGVDVPTAKKQLITELLKAFSMLDLNPKLKAEVIDHCDKRMISGLRRN